MAGVPCGPVQTVARLVADRNAMLPAKINDFLKARPTGAFGDEDPVHGAARAERFPDGMDSSNRGH